LIEIIEESIGTVPEYIDKKIQQISSQATLKGQLRQAITLKNLIRGLLWPYKQQT